MLPDGLSVYRRAERNLSASASPVIQLSSQAAFALGRPRPTRPAAVAPGAWNGSAASISTTVAWVRTIATHPPCAGTPHVVYISRGVRAASQRLSQIRYRSLAGWLSAGQTVALRVNAPQKELSISPQRRRHGCEKEVRVSCAGSAKHAMRHDEIAKAAI